MVIFHSYVNVYQRVECGEPQLFQVFVKIIYPDAMDIAIFFKPKAIHNCPFGDDMYHPLVSHWGWFLIGFTMVYHSRNP